MGIMVPIARAILKEHARRPIGGHGLLIGRQTVPLTTDEAIALLDQEGIRCINREPALDTSTRFGKDRGFISDIGFFSMFSTATFKTLDVTDYEHAEIVHDMHIPVPDELADSFDFIWTGSCLDNMFDPATAMKSTGRMLKRGGVVICMEMGSPHFDAYTMYSQSWFFDYFAINGFDRATVKSCVFDPADIWDGPYDVYIATNYEDASRQFPMAHFPRKSLITLSIAQKGTDTTWDRMPIQWQYRPDHEPYREAFARMNEPLPTTGRTVPERPGFRFIGTLDAIPGRRFPAEVPSLAARARKALANPRWAAGRLIEKARLATGP